MRRLVLLLLAVSLIGCADRRALREARLAQFVGVTEPVLISQIGVPNRSYQTEGTKYLAYDDTKTDFVPGPVATPRGLPFWGWQGGLYSPQMVTFTCETTFVVTEGVVRSFTLRGNACG